MERGKGSRQGEGKEKRKKEIETDNGERRMIRRRKG